MGYRNVKEKDIISFQMTLKFFYKKCEVTFRKFNGVNVVHVIGLSNFGNILEQSNTVAEKMKFDMIMDCIKHDCHLIEDVYQSLVNKEFGKENQIL